MEQKGRCDAGRPQARRTRVVYGRRTKSFRTGARGPDQARAWRPGTDAPSMDRSTRTPARHGRRGAAWSMPRAHPDVTMVAGPWGSDG